MTLHENGPWVNLNGLLYNKTANAYAQAYETAVGIADGCVLKAGRAERVTDYMKIYEERMRQILSNDPPEITIIEFNNFQMLSPDDICTLLNYFLNSIPYERIKEILSMSESNLREKIQELQNCGF